MAGCKGGVSGSVLSVGKVAMRNALGLMLASVVAAMVIAGVWFWKFAPRADASSPQTIAARPADTISAATRTPGDDVEVTASISDRLAALPTPATQKPACTKADALGVARVVEIDTTGAPGLASSISSSSI